jgi:hypothetical protein
MQESFIKLLIASIFAFLYVEALAWLRYKGKISRILVSLAIGVGCGVIMTWGYPDLPIFPLLYYSRQSPWRYAGRMGLEHQSNRTTKIILCSRRKYVWFVMEA